MPGERIPSGESGRASRSALWNREPMEDRSEGRATARPSRLREGVGVSAVSAYEATQLLAQERPDLLPLLRKIVDGGDGFYEGERPEDLDELVRRGLLERDWR